MISIITYFLKKLYEPYSQIVKLTPVFWARKSLCIPLYTRIITTLVSLINDTCHCHLTSLFHATIIVCLLQKAVIRFWPCHGVYFASLISRETPHVDFEILLRCCLRHKAPENARVAYHSGVARLRRFFTTEM